MNMKITTNYQFNLHKSNLSQNNKYKNPTFAANNKFLKELGGNVLIASSAAMLAAELLKMSKSSDAGIIETTIEPQRLESFFKEAGLKFQRNKQNGLYSINTFDGSKERYQNAVKKYNINEDQLFENIQKIEGNAKFAGSGITSLGNLHTIGGCAYFTNSEVTDTASLAVIGCDAIFTGSKLTSSGNILNINGCATLHNSKIEQLPNLKYIGKDLVAGNCPIKILPELIEIGRNAYFCNSNITEANKLSKIGRDAYINDSQLINADSLKIIGRDLYCKNSKLTTLTKVKIYGTVFMS